MKLHTRITAATCAAILASTALVAQQPLQYPVAKKGDQVDVYHGTKVADPYRWLEDDMSPETAAWVEAENKVTFPYLEAIPYRAQLQARVKQLSNYAKYSSPSARARITSSPRTTACRTRASSTSRRASTARRRS